MSTMTQTQPKTSGLTFAELVQRNLPVVWLLFANPRKINLLSLALLAAGLLVGWAVSAAFAFPLWLVTLIILAVLMPAGLMKWRIDRAKYGGTVMLLSIVLITQGLHTIEHVTQFAQYYLLLLPARQSNGLLSPANSEVVHFVWNWGVLIVVIALIRGGMRNIWMYLLLAVATGHTFEHSYMFIRYLIVFQDLQELGVGSVTAQGLAGIFGRDGWLARSPVTRGTFLSFLPGLTTAMRLDVHFWWNALELFLLLLAGRVFLRREWLQGANTEA